MFQGLSKRGCSVKRKVPSSRRRGRGRERGRGEAGGEKRELILSQCDQKQQARHDTTTEYYGTNSSSVLCILQQVLLTDATVVTIVQLLRMV
jgi:hypothetical protein